MKKERFNSILKAVSQLAVMMICENANAVFGLSPFVTPFFVALLYFGKSYAVSSVSYILSGIIYDFSPQSVVARLACTGVAIGVSLVCARLKKPLGMLALNALTLVCRIPELVIWINSGSGIYLTIAGALTGQVFSYVVGVALQALLVRGVRIRFTVDELVCMGVCTVVLCSGLYECNVLGVRPFYAISAFCILASTYALGPYGVVISALFGLGAGLGGEGSYMIPAVSGALVCLAFRSFSPYLAGLGFCLSFAGVGYFFGESGFTLASLGASCVGALAFCLLPKKIMEELGILMSAIRERYGGRGIVNRSRAEISRRLSALASLFWDMSALTVDTLPKEVESGENIKEISDKVVNELCADCAKKAECEDILDGKCADLLEPAVYSAVKKGKATLLELPSYLTGSCTRVNAVIPLVNRLADENKRIRKQKSHTVSGRMLLGRQFFETGELLGSIAVDTKRAIGFDTAKERLVMDELAYKSVVCSEVVIESGGERVVVLAKDARERVRAIEKVVSHVMKKSMTMSVEPDGERKGFDLAVLEPACALDMAFGEASSTKDGERESGDSRLILRPARQRYILAIADGMGSGARAGRASGRAVSMIEGFYKAGFNHETAISLVNSLLTFSGDDCYNTLDMCVCDLPSKSCDFIKMGACPAFVKSKGVVDIIEGESLPMGALDEVSPSVIRRDIHVGDMIVLVSDGVTDSMGVEELRVFIEGLDTPNPQEMANEIKKRATKKGALDDVSVAVGKVYQSAK